MKLVLTSLKTQAYLSKIFIALTFVGAYFSLSSAKPAFAEQLDKDQWLHIEVVSFNYYQDEIDGNGTSPEFAWLIQENGRTLARIPYALGNIYAPVSITQAPLLTLAEVDADKDHNIESFQISENLKNISFKDDLGSAKVIIKIIYPNAKSGNDHLPELASNLTMPVASSVSFLNQDATDYYKITAKYNCSLIIAREPILTESLLGRLDFYPRKKPAKFTLAISRGEDLLRIRAIPGSAKSRYFIYPLPENSCEEEALHLSHQYVKEEKMLLKHHFLQSWSRTFTEFPGNYENDYCLKQSYRSLEQEVFCAHVLSQHQSPGIRKQLKSFIKSSGSKTRRILRKLEIN